MSLSQNRTTQFALWIALFVLLAAIGAVLISGQSSGATANAGTQSSAFDGPTMPPNLHASNFSLLDQNGKRVTLSNYRGRVVVLTFIHSLCHDACPFMVEQIKGALNDLPDAGRTVEVVGVTAEPAQDTVANRRKFLAQHEMTGRLAYLNGPLPVLKQIWHAYAIEPVTPKIDHSTFVLLIDKRGIERVGFPADELTPEGLAHDIGVLEHQPA